MKFGKFLVGLGIGAVAGLLLAPKKGSELREDIKRESLKAYDNLKNMTKEDLEAMLGQTIETVKKSVDEFDIDTFKATTRDKLNELEAKLEDFAAKVKDSDQYLTIRDGVVDLTQKVNDKIEEVKTKVLDSSVDDDYLEAFENEIENVEEKLALNILKGCCIFLGKIKILKNVDQKIEKLTLSVNNFNNQFNFMRGQKSTVIQMFIAATIQSLLYYSITYMVYRAFGNSGVSIFNIIPAQAFLLMLMTFIPTPGSGGGAEGGFLLIFNSIFKNGTINLAILFWRIYTFYLPIIFGALFLIPFKKKDKKIGC